MRRRSPTQMGSRVSTTSPNSAGSRPELLRSQTYSQAEDGATAFIARGAGSELRGSVEIPIDAFDQRRVGQYTVRTVEGVQCGQRAGWGDLEDSARVAHSKAAACPVEVPVRGLDQRRAGSAAVPAAEAVQRGQRTARSDFEHRAAEVDVAPAEAGGSVEIAVGALKQGPERLFPVRAVEGVQHGQCAGWGDFENRTESWFGGPAAVRRGSVEVPVRSLNQRRRGSVAVRLAKAGQSGHRTGWSDFEDRPATYTITGSQSAGIGPAAGGGSVKISVLTLDQRRRGSRPPVPPSVVRVPLRVILKTVLFSVVPYKLPSVAWISPATGLAPSVQPTFKQKL
jgi:hypothetical protein